MLFSQAALGRKEARSATASGRHPPLDAELYLLSANVEAEIARYLLENGVTTDAKTRQFLANLRDVMGALARRAKTAACDTNTLSGETRTPVQWGA